jgi:hypothetical protein
VSRSGRRKRKKKKKKKKKKKRGRRRSCNCLESWTHHQREDLEDASNS